MTALYVSAIDRTMQASEVLYTNVNPVCSTGYLVFDVLVSTVVLYNNVNTVCSTGYLVFDVLVSTVGHEKARDLHVTKQGSRVQGCLTIL